MAPRLSVVSDDAPPQSGHNTSANIPVDQDPNKYGWLKDQIIKAEAGAAQKALEKKQADSLVTKARKTFQAHGGSLAEFDLVRELAEMDNPDEARERLARLVSYLGFEGISLPKLDASVDPYDKVPDGEREKLLWRERGYVAAMTGKGAFAGEAPDGCPSDMRQEWATGVNAGHEEIAARLSKAGPLFDNLTGDDEDEDGE